MSRKRISFTIALGLALLLQPLSSAVADRQEESAKKSDAKKADAKKAEAEKKSEPAPKKEAPKEPVKAPVVKKPARSPWLALKVPLQLENAFDGPLPSVIAIIGDLSSAPGYEETRILVDEKAIGQLRGEMFDSFRVTINLPKLPGATLEEVLNLICDQMGATNSEVGFYLTNNAIVIAPKKTVPKDLTSNRNLLVDGKSPFARSVFINTSFAPCTYGSVIEMLKRDYGVNIVTDPDVEASLRLNAPSLSLQDVTVLNVVRLVATLAKVELAVLDNTLFLTTPDKVAKLNEQSKDMLQPKKWELPYFENKPVLNTNPNDPNASGSEPAGVQLRVKPGTASPPEPKEPEKKEEPPVETGKKKKKKEAK